MIVKLSPLVITMTLLTWSNTSTQAQELFEYERKPIDYHNQQANNAITRLQRQVDTGTLSLPFSNSHGYLQAFLEQLGISPTSQSLVFSKSSQQFRRITPARPRALYFNDHTYVGWVQGGDIIEIITADPLLGTVFYTLRQRDVLRPQFERDKGQCLQCHGHRRTKDVPGPVIRSLFTEASGQPVFNLGNYVSDHTSPFSQRWGGYFVTGRHGSMLHMGNATVDRNTSRDDIDLRPGANLTDLSTRMNTRPYLTSHSDIVALMVLEHQTQMQNLLTVAHFEERRGRYYDRALQRDEDDPSDLTRRRIGRAAEAVVRYMLFVDEFPLRSAVSGTSGFSEEFSRRGPRDPQGRSLYQLDLKTRLFKYPLSYMIYTKAFKQLPPMTAAYVSQRLHDVLTARETDDTFPHLDLETRQAILEILRQTHPGLAKNW